MSGYVTVNRLSLVQLHIEERKQRAHLKKIAEMQRRSGVDNSPPAHFPLVNRKFPTQIKQKYNDLARENDAKSKKILGIMQSKPAYPPPPPPLSVPSVHPSNLNRRYPSLYLSQSNIDFLDRVAKTKGIYDAREWKKGFEEHKEHLKISKDNKLFTPRDMGINRQRIRGTSVINSRRTTPTSSVINMGHQSDNNN